MDKLTDNWHKKFVFVGQIKLDCELSGNELFYIDSRLGDIALELIED